MMRFFIFLYGVITGAAGLSLLKRAHILPGSQPDISWAAGVCIAIALVCFYFTFLRKD